jgi:hypothetical protein
MHQLLLKPVYTISKTIKGDQSIQYKHHFSNERDDYYDKRKRVQDCLNLLSPKYQIVLQMSKIIKQDEQSGILSMMMNNMPLTYKGSYVGWQ